MWKNSWDSISWWRAIAWVLLIATPMVGGALIFEPEGFAVLRDDISVMKVIVVCIVVGVVVVSCLGWLAYKDYVMNWKGR